MLIGYCIKKDDNPNKFQKAIRGIVLHSQKGHFHVPHIDLCMTTFCSLSCKNCSQWNPYIENKKVYPADDIIADMKSLTEVVDYVDRVALIGGEALINKETYRVIEYLCNNPKIGKIVLVTNGTIPFSKEMQDVIVRCKPEIWIDKYGDNSQKADEMEKFCLDNNVPVWNDAIKDWFDLGCELSPKISDNKMKRKAWNTCWLRNCILYIEGKLYRCGRAFVLDNNGILSPEQDSIVNVRNITDKKQMRKALWNFYGQNYIEACAFCNGPEDRKRIDPGEQV